MKKLLCTFLVFCLIFTLAACGKKEQETTTQTTIATTTATTTEKVILPPANRLTGERNISEAAAAKRPIAITVNNIKTALPQYGISAGDIVMEFPVEGGITRLLVLYGDQEKIPQVCTVRSCRYYFPIFAHGFDAVYICFGCNATLGRPTLDRIGIDYLDGDLIGDSDVFERDSDRLNQGYAWEHTAYFKGPEISNILKKYEIRENTKWKKDETAFKFIDDGKTAKGKTPCVGAHVNFSDEYFSTFSYDKDKGVYYKTHCGNPHMDSKADAQLSFENVILLNAKTGLYAGTYLVEIDWHGGTGTYLTEGTSQKITWKKESEAGKLKFYDESGKELAINRGKSYIGVGPDTYTLDTGVAV